MCLFYTSSRFAIVTFFLLLCPLSLLASGRTIHIVGDSTASTYGNEVYPRMGWGQVLHAFYGESNTVANLAKSGRSSRSFIEEGFLSQVEAQLNPGDLLLIQFGHNDQKIDSPERYSEAHTEFKEQLRRYISLAKEYQVTPVLLTPVVRRRFVNKKLVPTHGDYPEAIRELASETDVALIDANELTHELVSRLGEKSSKALYLHSENGDSSSQDNTHFSELGAFRVAEIVAGELDRLNLISQERTQAIILRVEKNGSGDTTKIQQAINLLEDSSGPAIILIGEGIFDEQLFFTRDDIALVGRGSNKTTLKTSLLRANWRTEHDDDWGASTINIRANDLTFMRLRVINDYGIITGDHSHQFAMRLLQGTRIISEDTTFITGGADTVSLWNKDSGMYYHRRAYFEGYTDFVCPRGWSYITDSAFFSRGGAAAIWHDGQRDESQKLVIKNSSFDGISNFILGRRHYDAQFYLIGNEYSNNMADRPIFRVTYEDRARNRPNLWGDRTYFYGTKKGGAEYAWLNDNIPKQKANISPLDAFEGKWDPEEKLSQIKVELARYHAAQESEEVEGK